MRHDTAKRHAVNKYTFQALPWPIKDDWNHIEALHPLVLELSYAQGTKEGKAKWRLAMKQLRDAPGYERLLPVHEKIRLVNDIGGTVMTLPARNDLTSVILPSTKFLDSFDPDRRMSRDELRLAIQEQRDEFDEMVQHPIQYEADRPDKPFEEIVDTYESFYMLEPIDIKWGRWGVTKCSCEDFMGAACCGHSTLMAMLYEHTLDFPSVESSKEIAKCAGNSKRPNAWAPEHEDAEALGGGKVMKLCPVTACDDMVLNEVNFSHNALRTCKTLSLTCFQEVEDIAPPEDAAAAMPKAPKLAKVCRSFMWSHGMVQSDFAFCQRKLRLEPPEGRKPYHQPGTPGSPFTLIDRGEGRFRGNPFHAEAWRRTETRLAAGGKFKLHPSPPGTPLPCVGGQQNVEFLTYTVVLPS